LDDPDNQRLLDQIGWHHAGIETARKRGKSLVSGLMDLFRSDNQASDPIPSDSASGAS